MTSRWLHRSAVALLVAMTVALAFGFVAAGPMPVGPAQHRFADVRAWGMLRAAANTLCGLPLILLAIWGLCRTRGATIPGAVSRPWQLFFVLSACGALAGMVYHQKAVDAFYGLSQTFISGASVILLLGFLAERVDLRCGSRWACAGSLLVVVAGAGLWSSAGDLRLLRFAQVLPVLLIPAGALNLLGRHTAGTDWGVMLLAYAVGHVFAQFDQALFNVLGWISGHTLMHLCMAVVVARLAYRAGMPPGAEEGIDSQPSASLKTSS
jgi:hypothetical protein